MFSLLQDELQRHRTGPIDIPVPAPHLCDRRTYGIPIDQNTNQITKQRNAQDYISSSETRQLHGWLVNSHCWPGMQPQWSISHDLAERLTHWKYQPCQLSLLPRAILFLTQIILWAALGIKMATVPDMLHMHLPKKYKETLLQASITTLRVSTACL